MWTVQRTCVYPAFLIIVMAAFYATFKLDGLNRFPTTRYAGRVKTLLTTSVDNIVGDSEGVKEASSGSEGEVKIEQELTNITIETEIKEIKNKSGNENERRNSIFLKRIKNLEEYDDIDVDNESYRTKGTTSKDDKTKKASESVTNKSDQVTDVDNVAKVENDHVPRYVRKETKQNIAKPVEVAFKPVKSTLKASPDYKRLYKDIVNPFDFDYIHNPGDKCKSGNIKTVFCVPFTPDKFESREKYRTYSDPEKSVSSFTKDPHNNSTMLFFLGKKNYVGPMAQALAETTDRKILEEVKKYNDIVQMDFVDSYKNLSLKSMSILKWVSTYCKDATFVIKTDADVGIKPALLVQGMERQHAKRFQEPQYYRFIIGKLNRAGQPIRYPWSKWYLPRTMYTPSWFPTFARGPTYGLTAAVAGDLFRASTKLPFLYLEDVFITGLCAKHANLTHVEHDRYFTYAHE